MKGRLLRAGGFTLLELLIAMSVFAIMATMAYGGLKSVIDTQQTTAARAVQIRQLQQALHLLNEDLQQALPRGVRDEQGDGEPALAGGGGEELLTLTRATPELLPASDHSQLLRVSYRVEDGALYRLVWAVLDRTPQSRPMRKRILDAESIEIRFLGSEWSGSWPASGAGLPRAVEVSIKLKRLGEIRRGFWLP